MQEGWLSPMERASVSAHFDLFGYTPGTIAVNVTWVERVFNVCQTLRIAACTHLSSTFPSNLTRKFKIYSNFKIQQHLSSTVTSYIGRKLKHFPTPIAFNAPVGVFPIPIGIPGKVYS